MVVIPYPNYNVFTTLYLIKEELEPVNGRFFDVGAEQTQVRAYISRNSYVLNSAHTQSSIFTSTAISYVYYR